MLHEKTQQKVVFLVDEYDRPLLKNLRQPVLDELKQVFNSFYSMVKSLDAHFAFIFVTGITKLTTDTPFSGIINWHDISHDKRYTALCGATEQELLTYFDDAIDALSGESKMDKIQVLAKIDLWYGGHCFAAQAPSVYHLNSLLNLFSQMAYRNYWFELVTPTFLRDMLYRRPCRWHEDIPVVVGSTFFMACTPEDFGQLTALHQTGYLTIKERKDGMYTLDFPNEQVKRTFEEIIVPRWIKNGLAD
jgi:hypothetical protein